MSQHAFFSATCEHPRNRVTPSTTEAFSSVSQNGPKYSPLVSSVLPPCSVVICYFSRNYPVDASVRTLRLVSKKTPLFSVCLTGRGEKMESIRWNRANLHYENMRILETTLGSVISLSWFDLSPLMKAAILSVDWSCSLGSSC